ncbi:hypothetical protein [Methylobacterium sp. Gmos1]
MAMPWIRTMGKKLPIGDIVYPIDPQRWIDNGLFENQAWKPWNKDIARAEWLKLCGPTISTDEFIAASSRETAKLAAKFAEDAFLEWSEEEVQDWLRALIAKFPRLTPLSRKRLVRLEAALMIAASFDRLDIVTRLKKSKAWLEDIEMRLRLGELPMDLCVTGNTNPIFHQSCVLIMWNTMYNRKPADGGVWTVPKLKEAILWRLPDGTVRKATLKETWTLKRLVEDKEFRDGFFPRLKNPLDISGIKAFSSLFDQSKKPKKISR